MRKTKKRPIPSKPEVRPVTPQEWSAICLAGKITGVFLPVWHWRMM